MLFIGRIGIRRRTCRRRNLGQGSDTIRWEQSINAFLTGKERWSGFMRTVRAYSGKLYRFFGALGRPLTWPLRMKEPVEGADGGGSA